MNFTKEILEKYPLNDADAQMFSKMFKVDADPESDFVLEVGSNEEPIAHILHELGYNVDAIDLREPLNKYPINHHFIRDDFCRHYFQPEEYTIVVAISCLEHFGLNTYGEGHHHSYLDVIAARKIWECLIENGLAYVSVPFGGKFREFTPHWRIYDSKALQERIVQDFSIEGMCIFVADNILIDGKERKRWDHISLDEAMSYEGDQPHISAMLKLRKVPVKRISPNGR